MFFKVSYGLKKLSLPMIVLMLVGCADSNQKKASLDHDANNVDSDINGILCKKADNTLSDLFNIHNVACVNEFPFTKDGYINKRSTYQVTHAPLFFNLQNDEFFEGEEDISEKILIGVVPINEQKFALIFAQKQGESTFTVNGESMYLSVINYGQIGNQDTNPNLGLFKVIYRQSKLDESDNKDFKILNPHTLKIYHNHESMEDEVVDLIQ